MELTKDVKTFLKLRKKLRVLEYARRTGSVAKALQELKVPKATDCKWRKIFKNDGEEGLMKEQLIAYNHHTSSKRGSLKKRFSSAKNISLPWHIKCDPEPKGSKLVPDG